MSTVHQNSAVASLNQNLVPGSALIDGRTEMDQLGFLAEYATLINFYDSDNKLSGSWQPFLLKDPVFLLAAISKTPYDKLHAHYQAISNDIRRSLNSEIRTISIGKPFNQLLDHITSVFEKIEMWSAYMIRSMDDYKLKNFVLSQLSSRFSAYFWAVLALRENLALNGVIRRIEQVDYSVFESYDELVWKQNRNKDPFWEILNLEHPVTKNGAADFFSALSFVADELYRFLKMIIHNATLEFEELSTKVSRHPDTTLLRTCVNLLRIHRDQLNGIASKHLGFYYRDILKQSEKPAVADRVFVSLDLAGKGADFSLKAQTVLNAGTDASKNPVLFAALKDTSLNPASVSQVFTISAGTENAMQSIYVQPVLNSGQVQKNESGQVQSWKTFGSSTSPDLIGQKLAFAFATPMLLLREGNRSAQITMTGSGEFTSAMFSAASFFLSTQKAWLDVTKFVKLNPAADLHSIEFTILLDSSQPPIEAFVQNPDGVQSFWPMLKITSDAFSDLANQPTIESLEIKVFASGIKNLPLYNDSGALSPKAPFQLFGSTPLYGNRFLIGSNEIFSKPLDALAIQFEWDKLPPDFMTYYQQYNAYIANPVIPVVSKKPGLLKGIYNDLKKIYGYIKKFINWLRRKKIPAIDILTGPFNNVCFTVEFNLLQGRVWKNFNMAKDRAVSVNPSDPSISTIVPYVPDPGCKLLKKGSGIQLFNTDGKTCSLQDTSFFSYPSISATNGANGPVAVTAAVDPGLEDVDPAIQNSPLVYTAGSSSGFMSVTLNGPDYGFGSGIYANVVSNVALKNAALISSQPQDPKAKLVLPPNPPFVPKVKTLTIDQYAASQKYDFTYQQGGYPIQCYHYTPFSNYLVYDNTQNQDDYWPQIGAAVAGNRKLTTGVSLFPHFEFQGSLLIGLEDLIFPCELNFYFELSRTYAQSNPSRQIYAYCLCNDYWQSMSIIADGTNNFSCSGILTVQVNPDITDNHFSMPSGKYWLAFCTKDAPDDFPQTSFLKTNGVEAIRTGTTFLSDSEVPELAAGAITRTQLAVPQLGAIVQPFASFGGKSAENATQMTRRVSNRIKTKDRAVCSEDIFRLINQAFSGIYYSKTVAQTGNSDRKVTHVYVVPSCPDPAAPAAFTPLVTECMESRIQTYLEKRTSPFANIRVSNFSLQYLQVIAEIDLTPGYEWSGVTKELNRALNFYLSPWIAYSGEQLEIDQPITAAAVSAFIRSVAGVELVGGVSFQLYENAGGKKQPLGRVRQQILPVDGILTVSEMNHIIKTPEMA